MFALNRCDIMGERNILFLCYTDGEMVYDPYGVTYDRPPSSCIMVEMGLNKEQLECLVCEVFGRNYRTTKVDMIFRCATIVGSGAPYFVPLVLNDESNVQFMWSTL